MRDKLHTWLYATRPHTLGASIAPMLILLGALINDGVMHWGYYAIVTIVAISAQISSNLANDYFGYKSGEDTEGRVGFTRLLTTGEVTPRAMLVALVIAIGVCSISGLVLVVLRGWELLIIGAIVLIGAIAYSAGKYSLARKALGDFSVVLFFGLIPILAGYYAVANKPSLYLLFLALGIGIWEANILVCNNYRDYDEDISSGKRTLVVRMGPASGPVLYLLNAFFSLLFLCVGLLIEGSWVGAILCTITALALFLNGYCAIQRLKGRSLNKLLRYTNFTTLVLGLLIALALLL